MAGQQEEAMARYGGGYHPLRLDDSPQARSLAQVAVDHAAAMVPAEPPALVNRIMLDVTDAQVSLMEIGRWARSTTGYDTHETLAVPDDVMIREGRLHDLERTVGALRSELDRLLSHLRGV